MKLTAVFLLAMASVAGAIDFRPILIETRGEGGKYSYLQFRDPRQAVTYLPPRTWKYHGHPDALRLIVPQTRGVEIDIRAQPLEEPPSGQAMTLEGFAELARQALPGAASKVELLAVEDNPLVIDGHRTVAVTFQYVIFGSPLKVGFLYLTRGRERLCFRVVAPPADFSALRQAFWLSLHSLAGL